MKVRAKHRFNDSGKWHKSGEVFETSDYEAIKEFVEPVQEVFSSEIFESRVPVGEFGSELVTGKPKHGRRKKTEE